MASQDIQLSFTSTTVPYRGKSMASMQIVGIQRARAKKCKELLEGILADDAKPKAPTTKRPKVQVFDSTVTTAPVTTLTDQANNLIARIEALLLNV